ALPWYSRSSLTVLRLCTVSFSRAVKSLAQRSLHVAHGHDGVPWNNNNAEHAVKRFAYYREVADGQFTEAGLHDYLVLLSLYLSCRYKEVSFLQFLLSQEKDIDAYCA